MPTFREFLAEDNVAYSFKTFDQLKGIAQPIPAGQPDLKPKDIGDAINDTVADTLSAFGMSGAAEDLRDHVDTAVEEVQDIIDGQTKKVKFVASAAGLKKTVDKLRKKRKRKKNVLMVKKLLKALTKLDSVVEHDKNNPAQKDIGQSLLSDKEHAKHIVGTAAEALSEKKSTESWGTWLINLFKKLWGGIKSIWKFIKSNIKIIASVILIVWVVWSAYTTGSLTDGVRMMSQQVVTVANTAWEACVGIFQSGYQWIMDYPVWFVKSAAGQTDILSVSRETLARVKAYERKASLAKAALGDVGYLGGLAALLKASGIGSAAIGAVGAAFGMTPAGAGVLVLSAVVGTGAGSISVLSDSMDASYRQDLLYEQQLYNAAILGSILLTLYKRCAVADYIRQALVKVGIKEENARSYIKVGESLAQMGSDAYKANIKLKKRTNRIMRKTYGKILAAGTSALGAEQFADAVEYDMNGSLLALEGKFNRYRERIETGRDSQSEFEKEMADVKIKENEANMKQREIDMKAYLQEQLVRLKTEVDSGMELTKENLGRFLDTLDKETKEEASENLYADEESEGELSDTPTEEMPPLSVSDIRLRF